MYPFTIAQINMMRSNAKFLIASLLQGSIRRMAALPKRDQFPHHIMVAKAKAKWKIFRELFLSLGNDRQVPRKPRLVGGVEGPNGSRGTMKNEISFARILLATACPGSPVLWAGSFTFPLFTPNESLPEGRGRGLFYRTWFSHLVARWGQSGVFGEAMKK